MGFLTALESNRLVSIEKGTWVQVRTLDIADESRIVWLRDFGFVKVFRTRLKEQVRHYAVYLDSQDSKQTPDRVLANFSSVHFEKLHEQHWQIEQYHRTIKQVCNIESFQVRNKTAVKNHIFSAICGYVKLQQMRATQVIMNCYQLQRELFNEVIVNFIKAFIPNMEHMNPQFFADVNA